MPKSKRGRSLFEVLDQQEDTASKKTWSPRRWERQPKTAAPAASGTKTGSATTAEPGQREVESSSPVPFIEVEHDRFRVSFTSLTAAVAVFGLLIVLFAVFWLGSEAGYKRGFVSGRLSYEAQAVNEIEVARNQSPASYLVEGLLAEVGTEAPKPADDDTPADSSSEERKWVRGHTYVVAQEFPNGNVEAVNRARDFLATHGISVELVRRPGGGLQLITTAGFNLKDPTQREMAEELRNRVHAAGAQYYASGGGYRLKGYFKTLKSDSW